jgi:hypothetical protein
MKNLEIYYSINNLIQPTIGKVIFDFLKRVGSVYFNKTELISL